MTEAISLLELLTTQHQSICGLIKLTSDHTYFKHWLLPISCMLILVSSWALRSLLLRIRMPEKEVVHLDDLLLLLLYRLISPATSTLHLLSHYTFPLVNLV